MLILQWTVPFLLGHGSVADGPKKSRTVCERLEEANFALCKILKAQKAQRRLLRFIGVDCWLGSQTKKLFLTLLVGCKDGPKFLWS